MKDMPIAFNEETQEIYKNEFKSELLNDLSKYEKQFVKGVYPKRNGKRALKFVWAFAKTADPTIKGFNRWRKQFNEKQGLSMFVRVNEALGSEVSNLWRETE